MKLYIAKSFKDKDKTEECKEFTDLEEYIVVSLKDQSIHYVFDWTFYGRGDDQRCYRSIIMFKYAIDSMHPLVQKCSKIKGLPQILDIIGEV